MHDEARAASEDRVELVLACRGEALIAALLEADELLVAEVPATRALIQVAADSPLVPNLRCADFDRGERDCGIQLGDLWMLGQVCHLHRGADFQSTARHRADRGVE